MARVEQHVGLFGHYDRGHLRNEALKGLCPMRSPIHRDETCGQCIPAHMCRFVEYGSAVPRRERHLNSNEIPIHWKWSSQVNDGLQTGERNGTRSVDQRCALSIPPTTGFLSACPG